MYSQTNKPTLKTIEDDMQKRIHKMYQSFPNAKVERQVERSMARKLGGPLAEQFFKDK